MCAHLFAFLTDHGLGLVDEDLWRGRGTNCDLRWSQVAVGGGSIQRFFPPLVTLAISNTQEPNVPRYDIESPLQDSLVTRIHEELLKVF